MLLKARLALAAGALFAVTACGVPADKSTDTGFSQLSMNKDSLSLKQMVGIDFRGIQDPQQMGQNLLQTFATSSRLMDSRMNAGVDCGSSTGTATDADNDGIPNQIVYNYSNCPYAAGTYSASLSIRDNNSADAKAGFIAQLTGLDYTGAGNVRIRAMHTLNLSASSGIYAIHDGTTVSRDDGFHYLELSSQIEGMYSPDGATTPWEAGTIQISQGTVVLARAADSSMALQVETTTPLHVSATCSSGPDRGTLAYTDAKKNRLIFTYAGCGAVSATYNGFAVSGL